MLLKRSLQRLEEDIPCHQCTEMVLNLHNAAVLIHLFVLRQPSSANTWGFQLHSARGSVLHLLGPEGEQALAVWEPSFIPSPAGESGSIPPHAAVLTPSHRSPTQRVNTDIPLGNNVFSRSSGLGFVPVHKHQHAECPSCIAKEHFLTPQWDIAFYLAVGCFGCVDFVVAPKVSYKVPQNSCCCNSISVLNLEKSVTLAPSVKRAPGIREVDSRWIQAT